MDKRKKRKGAKRMRKRHVFKTGTAMLLAAAMMITSVPANVTAAEAAVEDNLIASYVFSDEDVTDKVIEDASGNGNDATLKGKNATITNGILTLPGGGHVATSDENSPAYVELPGDMFEGQDTLTITTWLKNQTGSNNYSAMFFGTKTKHVDSSKSNDYPLNYWLLNPQEKDKGGMFKSVWTNSDDAGAPYKTETPVSTTATSSGWGMYTTVITPTSIAGYYNGVEVCNSSKTKTTTDFGTDLVAYIGRSGYADIFYKGGVYGVRVYNTALTQDEITSEYNKDIAKMDALELDLGDLSAVRGNLELPTTSSRGCTISWESSKPEVIDEDGTVVRDKTQDIDVVLTATISYGGESTTKTFHAKVICGSEQNLFEELKFPYVALEGDAELPSELTDGVSLSWESSNTEVLAIHETADGVTAKVVRPEKGSEDVKVILTAKITGQDVKKEYEVIVRAEEYAQLMAYTNSSEDSVLGNSLHLAYSEDGENYTALNSNTGICFAKNVGGSKGVNPNGLKNLYLFRKLDGSYGLVATNVSTQKYIYVFDSENLVDFTNERTLTLGSNVSSGLQVERNGEGYKIYWSDGSKQYMALTEDFETVISQEEEVYTVESKTVSGTKPTGAVVGNMLGVSKSEYQYVINRLGIVKNTGMKEVAVTAQAGDSLNEVLPEKVTAEYNDGSTKDMSVIWDAEDIAAVDLSKAGSYTISGTVQQTQYANSFIEQRADPCILKGNDGYYYFTASYPMCGQDDGYDKVVLRRAKSINGLATAEEITIWDCDESADEYRYIWAPEIRLVNDEYYVFYTSSINSNVWSIRPHVLKCTNPEDIMNKKSWKPMGVMQAVSSDSLAFTGFSLDMTVFENKGRWYAIWAQSVGFSSLLIAEIDPEEPWKCISESVVMTVPEYSWERIYENVNEGPSIIKNGDGKIYMAFSASATGPEYCIGLMSIDEDDDMLDPSAWKKQAYPVLTSSDVPGEYGPGHNSFTVDEDGNPIFVYHARGEACYKNQCAWASQDPLYDPCRDARLKRVHWAIDGSPILKMSYEEELAEEFKKVTATVTVAEDTTEKEVTGISLDKEELVLVTGDRATLTATVTPADATNKTVKYTSSNPAVATVSQTGLVVAVGIGTATITATAGSEVAECIVRSDKAAVIAEDTFPETIIAGNYELPTEIEVTFAGKTENVEVIWNKNAEDLARGGEVTVIGHIPSLGNVEISVTLNLIGNYIYFIDAGVGEWNSDLSNSSAYDEVAEILGENLRNDKPDGKFAEDGWGLSSSVGTSDEVKAGEVDVANRTNATDNIYTNGWWAGENKDIVYTFPLEAGTYVATGYFAEWWNGSRTMDFYAEYTNKLGKNVKSEVATVSVSKSSTNTGSVEFTVSNVTDKTNVNIIAKKNGNSDGVISGLAIEKIADNSAQEAAREEVVNAFGNVKVSPSERTLLVGESVTLTPVYPADYEAKLAVAGMEVSDILCASDNTSVAIVDNAGVVTAKTAGKATITMVITYNDGNKLELKAVITVSEKKEESSDIPTNNNQKEEIPSGGATDTNTQKEETFITLSETKISMGLKEKNVKLTADVKGSAKGQTITWTSSNTKVATVKDGKVTASKNKTGKTIITATTADGKTATCEVNVKKAPKSLTLNKKSVTLKLKKNKTFQIKVKKYKPSNAASYKLTYKSSKKKVATVSKTGLVTAKKAGTAKITVKTYNGKTAKITIKVKK